MEKKTVVNWIAEYCGRCELDCKKCKCQVKRMAKIFEVVA